MLDKQHGLVPCAHCGLRASDQPCLLCERMICAPCVEQLDSCPEPRPQALRLPRGARGLDTDRRGRCLIYAAKGGRLDTVDLLDGSAAKRPHKKTEALKRLKRGEALPWSCLLESGALVYIERRSDITGFKRLVTHVIAPAGSEHIVRKGFIGFSVRAWLFSSDEERYCFSVRGVYVDALDPTTDPPRFTTAFRAPWDVTVGAASDRCGVLALGAERTLQLFGRGSGWVELGGDLLWVGFTTERSLLVAAAAPGQNPQQRDKGAAPARRVRLLALDVEDGEVPDDVELRQLWDSGVDLPARVGGPVHVSASTDGQLVALRGPDDDLVTTIDLEGGEQQILQPAEIWPRAEVARSRPSLLRRLVGGGAVKVDLVRFVDGDRRLITSLSDGRVVVWYLREGRVFVQ